MNTIEKSLVESQIVKRESMEDSGYHATYSITADNLHLGFTVADSVNPVQLTLDGLLPPK